MRVEVGAPIVLVAGVEQFWHLPRRNAPSDTWTVCGLEGLEYAYAGPLIRRRLCPVCSARGPAAHHRPELGPLPRGGGKPKGKWAKLSEERLEALHRLHVVYGVSVRELARRGWRQWGYANANACASALTELLRDRGFEVRNQRAATAAANRARSTRLEGEDKNAYRRRWRKETRA